MPANSPRIPKYCRHKATGQAYVTLGGKRHYLGNHGSEKSKERYRAVVAELVVAPEVNAARPCNVSPGQSITIVELAIAYWKHAKDYYRKDGDLTTQVDNIRQALKPLKNFYSTTPVNEFGPLKLAAIQEHLIGTGICRNTINDRVKIIKAVFKWGVATEIVPPSVYHGLLALPGLRLGRTDARESEPVQPVADEIVDATIPALPAVIADMIRFQRATGCRPGEVCIVRPRDVDRSGEVWTYRPSSHKTQHHGRGRTIYIGPNGQEILRQYLLRPDEAFCFSPKDSEKKRLAKRHADRKTPLSCGNRPGNNRVRRPKRSAGDRYDSAAYRRAVTRAVNKINRERKIKAKKEGIPAERVELLPNWAPRQLRHTAGTAVRKAFGLEAAQVTLGHAKADVTQIYAERDAELARSVAAKIG